MKKDKTLYRETAGLYIKDIDFADDRLLPTIHTTVNKYSCSFASMVQEWVMKNVPKEIQQSLMEKFNFHYHYSYMQNATVGQESEKDKHRVDDGEVLYVKYTPEEMGDTHEIFEFTARYIPPQHFEHFKPDAPFEKQLFWNTDSKSDYANHRHLIHLIDLSCGESLPIQDWAVHEIPETVKKVFTGSSYHEELHQEIALLSGGFCTGMAEFIKQEVKNKNIQKFFITEEIPIDFKPEIFRAESYVLSYYVTFDNRKEPGDPGSMYLFSMKLDFPFTREDYQKRTTTA